MADAGTDQAQEHAKSATMDSIVPSSPASDATKTVLKKGDLVRVAERYVSLSVKAMLSDCH